MKNDLPIYNSRIIKTYLEYLTRYYPDLNINRALHYAGMTRYQVEDRAHWFNQDQVDRFYKILVEMTINPHIAREAGRFAASAEGLGYAKQYTLGLMSPVSAYQLMERLYPLMSRGAEIQAQKLGSNKVEIISTPGRGVEEKPYQCENRKGFFEAIGSFFTEKFAQVEEASCFHKGEECCRYIITWENTPSMVWKRLRNYSLLVTAFGLIGSFFVLPTVPWAFLVLLSFLLIGIFSLCSERAENKELRRTIRNQGETAEDKMGEINIGYTNALLVQEIGKATSSVLDIGRLIERVVAIMEEHLDFDRGLIMLTDKTDTRLVYASGYGYSKEEEEFLRQTEFHLDRPDSKGMFVLAFKDQKPFLISDISDIEGMISEKSKAFIERMGVHSFMCTPIVYEEESLGILAVDNRGSKRDLTQSDLNLLMGVASQIAISIANASSFEKLERSEEKYRTILQSIEEGYYEVDFAGNLTFFNDSLCRILGYHRDELISMNFRRYTDKKNARKVHQVFNQASVTERPHKVEHEIMRKDGAKRNIEVSVCLIENKDGHRTGFRGIVRDTTERMQAEKALREHTERLAELEQIINHSPAVIFQWRIDEGYPVEFVSDNIRQFGYLPEDFYTGRASYLDVIHPDDRERVAAEVVQYRDNGMKDFIQEYRMLTQEGEVRWIYNHTWKRFNDKGEATHYQGLILDMTKEMQLKEQERRLEAQLERAKKMEAMGALAGGVAHDLNNILSGLVSYPELLLLQLPENSPLRKPILTIQRSGEKAAAIVQDLLTLARRGVPVTEVVNLNEIILDYLQSPEHQKLMSYHPEVIIETQLEMNPLSILGSPVHLSKTVMNLISNAAEAVSERGEIIVRTQNRYVDRPIAGYDQVKEGDYLVLTVSDTGSGISSEDIEGIFEPFYTKKHMGRSGTGLGMAVVWGTVKDHEGYIDVQSAEGEGTTFILYFPVTREKLQKDISRMSIEDYMGKGESLLVVDDVEDQRRIACGMLEELGYSVTSVSSGEEAVEYMKHNSADLLIMDMIMDPGIDGLETYKRILKFRPGQKAIIASGFSETKRVKEAQRLGAGQYIKKPYLIEKIGMAVRAELDK